MKSTYYPGVCTKPGTYYQGWFMYMRYTQGQNEEYILSRSMYLRKYVCTNVRIYHCSVHIHIHTYIQCTHIMYTYIQCTHTYVLTYTYSVHILCIHT